jgi:hypothetical protein
MMWTTDGSIGTIQAKIWLDYRPVGDELIIRPSNLFLVDASQALAHGQTKSHFLPALAVGLFSGARPAEITRTGWTNVSMPENRINIPGNVGKTHQYRCVRIEPILRQWLEFIGVKKTGWLIPRRDIETYERWRQQLAAAAGMAADWPHDVLRHTDASFDYAIRGDFKDVSKNLDNTPGISRRSYIAPASLKEAKQLLSLTPKRILKLIAKHRRQGTRTGRR